jgi:Asp-tRNA(Asn)/Glu-tRNA(Gln) amidotransferase A subunit family amidase
MKKIVLIMIAGLIFIMFKSSNAQENKFTKNDIKSGQKIIGMEFNDSEIDSLQERLTELLNDYNKIWSVGLNNSIPPALGFNPIPVGFESPNKSDKFEVSDYSNTKMPDNNADLAYYSVGQLAELIRTKKITSVELTRLFLDRLKKYDPKLECVITLTEELAIKQAERADKEIEAGKYRGLLHGIPYGAKDLLATKEYKTTWGAVPYKDQVINQNATVINKLEEAGAVLVAKLTMGALAWGDVWFGGKTKNPWNVEEGSSGSSAGPASATSAGLIPFAIGTETWGSIVSPSTVCGVSGLRPTYGRVSRTGAMALSWSMDKIGPICRNAEDLAIVFNSINGQDNVDQSLYDYPFNYSGDVEIKNLKIGYLKNDFNKNYPFHSNDSLTLQMLKSLGAELIPIELPNIPVESISFILSTEAAAAFDELTRSNKDDLLVRQIKNAWPNVFREARFIPAVEYINANRIRYTLIQEMESIMKNIDLYIAPSWVGDNLLLTNLTGHPCVVVPNGFSEDGTPTSISFIGKLFDEGKIIEVAKAYQDATDFHLKHPEFD